MKLLSFDGIFFKFVREIYQKKIQNVAGKVFNQNIPVKILKLCRKKSHVEQKI